MNIVLLFCTCFVVVQVTVDLMHKADEYFQNQARGQSETNSHQHTIQLKKACYDL
jgi:hypothetical protein